MADWNRWPSWRGRSYGEILEQEAADDLAHLAARDRSRRARDAMFFGVAGAVAIVGMFGLWGIHDSLRDGVVEKTEWKQEVIKERWTQGTVRLWKHQTRDQPEVPPVGGVGEQAGIKFLGECRREHFRTDQYPCGTEPDPFDDNGGTRTKYCEDRVYKDRCTYQTQRWEQVDSDSLSGVDSDPVWPELPLGELDRARHIGTYQVHVKFPTKAGSDRITTVEMGTPKNLIGRRKATLWKPPGERDFRKWTKGDEVCVRVNNFGIVTGVQKDEDNGIIIL